MADEQEQKQEFGVLVEMSPTSDPDDVPDEVHVQVSAPGLGGVDWHWYTAKSAFTQRNARRFFGVEGLSFAEEDREDIMHKIVEATKPIDGLTFPRG